MKTAISLPDEVFESAEQLAKRLGQSRSELYATALRDYLEKNNDRAIREALDKLYANEDSKLDPRIARLQSSAIREQW